MNPAKMRIEYLIMGTRRMVKQDKVFGLIYYDTLWPEPVDPNWNHGENPTKEAVCFCFKEATEEK